MRCKCVRLRTPIVISGEKISTETAQASYKCGVNKTLERCRGGGHEARRNAMVDAETQVPPSFALAGQPKAAVSTCLSPHACLHMHVFKWRLLEILDERVGYLCAIVVGDASGCALHIFY